MRGCITEIEDTLVNALLAAALSLAASARSCSESSFGSDRLSVESVGEGALEGRVDRAERAGDDGVDDEASVLIVVHEQLQVDRWETSASATLDATTCVSMTFAHRDKITPIFART